MQEAPLRLLVDFNRLSGTTVAVGPVDSWPLAGLPLTDGMTVIFEQPGELQMAGVLRQTTGAAGAYWSGELDPTSLVDHVRLDAGTLTRAGPTEVARLTAHDPERAPAEALTLGVEGTHEAWARSLAGATPVADGRPLVLVDERDEVDARARVLTLDLQPDYPAGRRVWLGLPE